MPADVHPRAPVVGVPDCFRTVPLGFPVVRRMHCRGGFQDFLDAIQKLVQPVHPADIVPP
eukprot:7670765-Heterocapsa_arctica.AAC.1